MDEASAFDQRLDERDKAGFVADIRDAVKCSYFYKSFFRDPYYFRSYFGPVVEWFLNGLKHKGTGLKILDVGCGPGFVSLELARAGHHVYGIDISAKSIEVAGKALKNNRYTDGFGSLKYEVKPFEAIEGKYDAVVFCGALHHFDNIGVSIAKLKSLLTEDGIVLCHEPCHERWRKQDAAQVALIRSLLSVTGHWYEEDIFNAKGSPAQLTAFDEYVKDIHDEYLNERDKHEVGGQSPNDLSSSGDEIVENLNKAFTQLEYRPGFSFIYRLLGGMRGEESITYKLADLLTTYDKYCTANDFMKPNGFFYVGRNTKN